MQNPFKFGTIVEDEFFTDRTEELALILQKLNSANHLVLISPRRFGKTSLVVKAVKQSSRPYLMVNLQNVISPDDLASKLLRHLFRLYPWERLKHLMKHFRFVPTISANPMTDAIDVSFQPTVDASVVLEDAFTLLEKLSQDGNRLVVIIDEFQEVKQIDENLAKQLRAIMQLQKHINYIFLGSQESMMEEIFEQKKSPFYHFGMLLHLGKIPYSDFLTYIVERLPSEERQQTQQIAEQILDITNCHPYYTQQLASQVWELMVYRGLRTNVVDEAVNQLTRIHDLDFERLWLNFNRTDKRIILELCKGANPIQNRLVPTSTSFSSIRRLMRTGYVIRTNEYEMEDPFFKRWIIINQLS